MMPVIVHNGDPVGLRLDLEAAVGAAEMFEALANLVGAEVELNPHGDGRQRVLHVVAAGHVDGERAQPSAVHFCHKARSVALQLHFRDRHIGSRLDAVGHHAPPELRQQLFYLPAPGWSVQAITAPKKGTLFINDTNAEAISSRSR